MSVPRLLWKNVVPRGDYHAALVSSRFRLRTQLHTHDFFEMIYVLDGRGTHEINGQAFPLTPGDLIFVRPEDRHAISAREGNELHIVNIAFSADAWEDFRALVGLTDDAFAATSCGPPPIVQVPVTRREECARVFQRA
ncbi:MAG: AraC family ligand binding domain-containing protein, partial [Thermomicrobiales bacterium]